MNTKTQSLVWAGALAGLAATLPMTIAMISMHRGLPKREQYPLPPSQITHELEEAGGVEDQVDQKSHLALTLANHFGFGAAAGALYGPLAQRLPGPAVARGIAYGLCVWTGSYLGWLPALGLRGAATKQPARRNLLMIAAHVVWGAVLGWGVRAVDNGRSVKPIQKAMAT